MKVTTPFESDGPLAAETTEPPEPGVNETASPGIGVPPSSWSVTVTVACVAPSATSWSWSTVTVESIGDTVGWTNLTPVVWAIAVAVSVSVAVYFTGPSTVVSVTVKVTTPSVPEGPLGTEITELPEPAASVTWFPTIGWPDAFLRVTVIVACDVPSAGAAPGAAATVEFDASDAANDAKATNAGEAVGANVMSVVWVTTRLPWLTSVAV